MGAGSNPVLSKNYVFDPRPRLPLLMVAKRYWVGELCPDTDDHDIFSKTRRDIRTLVFIHGVACHKELWEPTIQGLFENEAGPGTSIRFRDMWSLDLLNHGDSAILNEEDLRGGYDIFPWEDHARCVHAFLAGLGTGVDVDFSKRRLSLVGHSMGGTISVLAPTYHPRLNISSLHLFEPHLAEVKGHSAEEGLNWRDHLVGLSLAREDIWHSAEDAYEALRMQGLFRKWDDRILKIFVSYGLRSLPTAEYPGKTEGVTLKCTKKQQAASFKDITSGGIAYRSLSHVLKAIPTHIAYGSIVDALPYDRQQDVLHVASGGVSNFASAITIPGTGHMMLATHTDVIANVTWQQLGQSTSHAPSRIIDASVAKL